MKSIREFYQSLITPQIDADKTASELYSLLKQYYDSKNTGSILSILDDYVSLNSMDFRNNLESTIIQLSLLP